MSRLPLPLQAQQYLLNLIESGAYQPGERLPSEEDLAEQLGISRPTLREALRNLEQNRTIVRKHGVGTFVARRPGSRLKSGLERLQSVLELAARQGLKVEYNALQVQEEPADPEMADKLQVTPNTLLTTVRRVIVVDRTPVAYMSDAVLASVLSAADVNETFNGSVLDLLRQQGLHIAQALADIIACSTDDILGKKLGVNPGQAVLLIEETLFDEEGTAVEFSRNYFVPDFFHFHVVRRL